jgi:type III restriction enzyme
LDKKRKEKIEVILETAPGTLTQPVLTNVVIENLDEVDAEVAGEVLDIELDDARVESLFNLILRSWVAPYGYERSAGRLKSFLFPWFGHAGFTPPDVQRIIACSEKNQDILGEIIAEAKAEFENQRHATIASKRVRTDSEFKLPLTDSFSGDYTPKAAEKHALQPYLSDNKWKTEERFEKYLEDCDEVVWWYKNGIKQLRYFAVPFIRLKEDGSESPAGFYPDYIVHYTSGKYGIYDTKGGDTVKSEDTKRKAEALQDYLANTLKNANFRGGIVDSKSNNTFLLNTSNIYDHTDKTQWTPFAPF